MSSIEPVTVETIIDQIVQDLTSGDTLTIHTWPSFLIKVMEMVEKHKIDGLKLVGGDKEAVAVGVLNYMVDRAPLDEVEKTMLKTVISYSTGSLIKGIIAVSKGEFDLNAKCYGCIRKFLFWA